jgi:hypothetical protein
MLSHLAAGSDDALAGDLLEEFGAGRSRGWYWRQVSGAIAAGIFRVAGNRGPAMVFASVWAMLAPVWLLVIAEVEEHAHLNGRFYRMEWPWSTVCDLGLLLVANLAFIWAGIVLYLLTDFAAGRPRRPHRLRSGIAGSLPVLMVIWVALITVPKYFIDVKTTDQRALGRVSTYAITNLHPAEVIRLAPEQEWSAQFGNPMVPAAVSPLSALTDMHNSTVLVRLLFLLILLCALWRATPRSRRIHGGISA